MTKEEMLSYMLVLATNSHSNQTDKAGMPYILHPITVMKYLNTTDIELMCIALGHDLLEDTDVTVDSLRNSGISERIIKGIILLTKWPDQSYEEYKEAVFSSRDAMLVKRADITHNTDLTRIPGCITNEKINTRMKKYLDFLRQIDYKLSYERIS